MAIKMILWSEIGKGHRHVKKNRAIVEIEGFEEKEVDETFIAMVKQELQKAFGAIMNDDLIHVVRCNNPPPTKGALL